MLKSTSYLVLGFSLLSGAAIGGCELSPPNLDVNALVGGSPEQSGSEDDAVPELDGDQTQAGNSAQDGGSNTANAGAGAVQPAPVAPPVAPECSAALDVTMDVKIHTLFVNNSLLIDGLFDWRGTGAGGQLVDLEFKTNATDWVTIAADLPSTDVKTIDLSHWAGASSSWHFRAATWHPACSSNLAYSEIISIQN
jgi:hypothetical protein